MRSATGGLTDLIVTDSMHERKRRMFEMADAFVVLPGGLGTLDETFEIVTWKQLRLHDSPIVVLDVNGYWSPLLDLVARDNRRRFRSSRRRRVDHRRRDARTSAPVLGERAAAERRGVDQPSLATWRT